ncbi:putative uncharacterized protein [Parachlamydia acanthamoebae UV-7]|uniref:Uncharacterized protein n=1 Tax=Parachlamydia acanthamoebae (strain UV7) TaxID=765952 RepID=F8KZ07_PARAV|nr:hypothetical protein [Parachlamydia acanthamoebae]CCB86130.1 putative uncharacterized protein [Parachlamydia acanthamoebae UV-7]
MHSNATDHYFCPNFILTNPLISFDGRVLNHFTSIPVVFKPLQETFIPSEESRDQIAAKLMQKGVIDCMGKLTEFYAKYHHPQQLSIYNVSRLSEAMQKPLHVYGFSETKLTISTFCTAIVNEASKHFDRVQACYTGSRVKKGILGKSYLNHFLNSLLESDRDEICDDLKKELDTSVRDEDIVFILYGIKHGWQYENVLKFLNEFARSFLAQSSATNHIHLKNNKVCPFFSLISWENGSEKTVYDITFIIKESPCFPEYNIRIPLDLYLRELRPLAATEAIFPMYESFDEGGSIFFTDPSQAFTDMITGIIHTSEEMNTFTWPRGMALLASGRKDYGHEMRRLTEKILRKVKTPFQIKDQVKFLLINFLNKHYENDEKACFAITCNACLALKGHVSANLINHLAREVIPQASQSPVFSLMIEGIFKRGLTFTEVMEIHQCFALLALSVKEARLKEGIEVFLTKHDGGPAIRIKDEKSILFSFSPEKGFLICLAKFHYSLKDYYERLLKIYQPKNRFSHEGSQLSSYLSHLKQFIEPLRAKIIEEGFEKHPTIRVLSFNLLLTCQTCSPSQADFDILFENCPSVLDAVPKESSRRHLLFNLQTISAFYAIEPWNALAKPLFEFLQNQDGMHAQVKNWIDACIELPQAELKKLAEKLWHQLEQNELYSKELICKMASSDLSIAFRMFKEFRQFASMETSYFVFIELSKILFENSVYAEFIIPFLEEASPLLEVYEPLSKPYQYENVFNDYLHALLSLQRHDLLLNLMCQLSKNRILDDSTTKSIWATCLRKMLSSEQLKEMGMAFLKQGKKFHIWQADEYRLNKLKYYLVLAEQILEGEIPILQKAIHYVCSWEGVVEEGIENQIQAVGRKYIKICQDESHISFIKNHLQARKKHVLMHILDNKIAERNREGALNILLQLLQEEEGDLNLKDKASLVFQILLELPIERYWLNGLIKIFRTTHFKNLFLTNERSQAILMIFEKVSKGMDPEKYPSAIFNLYKLLLEAACENIHKEGLTTCINVLLEYQTLPNHLEETLNKYQMVLLDACLAIHPQQLVDLALKFIQLNLFSDKSWKLLKKISLENEIFDKQIIPFHHIWKAYYTNSKNTLSLVLTEKLIASLLKDPKHISLAFYWMHALLPQLIHISYGQVALFKQMAPLPKEMFTIIEIFYDRKLRMKNSAQFAWIVLIKELKQNHCLKQLVKQKGAEVLIHIADEPELLLHISPVALLEKELKLKNFSDAIEIVKKGLSSKISDEKFKSLFYELLTHVDDLHLEKLQSVLFHEKISTIFNKEEKLKWMLHLVKRTANLEMSEETLKSFQMCLKEAFKKDTPSPYEADCLAVLLKFQKIPSPLVPNLQVHLGGFLTESLIGNESSFFAFVQLIAHSNVLQGLPESTRRDIEKLSEKHLNDFWITHEKILGFNLLWNKLIEVKKRKGPALSSSAIPTLERLISQLLNVSENDAALAWGRYLSIHVNQIPQSLLNVLMRMDMLDTFYPILENLYVKRTKIETSEKLAWKVFIEESIKKNNYQNCYQLLDQKGVKVMIQLKEFAVHLLVPFLHMRGGLEKYVKIIKQALNFEHLRDLKYVKETLFTELEKNPTHPILQKGISQVERLIKEIDREAKREKEKLIEHCTKMCSKFADPDSISIEDEKNLITALQIFNQLQKIDGFSLCDDFFENLHHLLVQYTIFSSPKMLEIIIEECLAHPHLRIQEKALHLMRKFLENEKLFNEKTVLKWMEASNEKEARCFFECLHDIFLTYEQQGVIYLRYFKSKFKNLKSEKPLDMLHLFFKSFDRYSEKHLLELCHCITEVSRMMLENSFSNEKAIPLYHPYMDKLFILFMQRLQIKSDDLPFTKLIGEKRSEIPACFKTSKGIKYVFQFVEALGQSYFMENIFPLHMTTLSSHLRDYLILLLTLEKHCPAHEKSFCHDIILNLIKKYIHWDLNDFTKIQDLYFQSIAAVRGTNGEHGLCLDHGKILEKIVYTKISTNLERTEEALNYLKDVEMVLETAFRQGIFMNQPKMFLDMYFYILRRFPFSGSVDTEQHTQIVLKTIERLVTCPCKRLIKEGLILFRRYQKVFFHQNPVIFVNQFESILCFLKIEKFVINPLLISDIKTDKQEHIFQLLLNDTRKITIQKNLALKVFTLTFDYLDLKIDGHFMYYLILLNLFRGFFSKKICEEQLKKYFEPVLHFEKSEDMFIRVEFLVKLLFNDIGGEFSREDQRLKTVELDFWLKKVASTYLINEELREYFLTNSCQEEIKKEESSFIPLQMQLLKNWILLTANIVFFSPKIQVHLVKKMIGLLAIEGEDAWSQYGGYECVIAYSKTFKNAYQNGLEKDAFGAYFDLFNVFLNKGIPWSKSAEGRQAYEILFMNFFDLILHIRKSQMMTKKIVEFYDFFKNFITDIDTSLIENKEVYSKKVSIFRNMWEEDLKSINGKKE